MFLKFFGEGKMISITSVSGGKTSAYLAANYPTDYYLFALVRTSDKQCLFPDPVLRKRVEERIEKPFTGTLEDDNIIYTIFDLEQFMGKKIDWVTGITFDEVLRTKGGWLPNKLHRYCTTHMKIEPMFYWWAEHIGEPVQMNIGYRANEGNRTKRMNERLNSNGLLEMKATFGKHKNGKNKWEIIEWQKPDYPLATDGVNRDKIEHFWNDKDVRFADRNNCVGCFHRNPLILKKMFEIHPQKMDWFERQEGDIKKFWRSDMPYRKIRESDLQIELSLDEFTDCDYGYCGL